MRHLLLLSILFVTGLNAQTLSFNKRFVQCEDRWVAFTPDKDSNYSFGFIYIDEQAGLTINHEGTFRILPSGKYVPTKFDSFSLKTRLQPNDVLVAFIPESKFQELKIEAVPDWLKYYKTDTNSVARLYKWGFMYNGWDECAKAVTYLERAQKMEADYPGLSVELAFSYNCLGQFDKAVAVLQDALKQNPNDAYTNKELIYALIKSGQLDKASVSCKNAIAVCTDKSYNGENCYNLLHEYYVHKDKDKFNLWLNEAKKWNAGKSQLLTSIATMEKAMNQ